MEAGKIIESGHFNELKENPNSFFRNVLFNQI
jgi:ABC-type dipeptide/oligopeptide/nickel transport system ATPase component